MKTLSGRSKAYKIFSVILLVLLALFFLFSLFLLIEPLRSAVQKETLVEQFAIFFNQLDIAHNVQQISVVMLHAVCDIDAVSNFLKGLDACL